ncbi:hypothetical protein ES707_22182 [subsurface metagenome]
MLIKLDEHQDRVLRDVADIIGRSRGKRAGERYLRHARLLARVLLTQWKITRPRQFEAWNFWRVATN